MLCNIMEGFVKAWALMAMMPTTAAAANNRTLVVDIDEGDLDRMFLLVFVMVQPLERTFKSLRLLGDLFKQCADEFENGIESVMFWVYITTIGRRERGLVFW